MGKQRSLDYRRKYQNDNRSREKARQMSDAQQQPHVEEKNFTEAEFKIFKRKFDAYQEAADKVNEFMAFLREQHGVEGEQGWQLGEKGFYRAIPESNGANGMNGSSVKRGNKVKPVAEPE
jgi:hypothetical protein